MKAPSLSPRLAAIASFVRPGARLSDVGTDHGYLPGSLLYNHQISFAVASDIAPAPLAKAEKYLKELSLEQNSATVLTPGLRGIEAYSPDDIVIAGMGGELIASILDDAPFIREKDIRLILQPMTKAEVLHKYLASAGFELLSERPVEEENKIYRILHCRYSGKIREITDIEAEFSPALLKEDRKTVRKMLFARKEQLAYIIREKKKSTNNTEKEEILLSEIEKLTENFDKEGETL